MSDLFQLLFMLAIPAAFFLICRFLNLRSGRTGSSTARTHWTTKA